ncbi:hypothetical protein Poly51_58230 [Rubripirellula tenax]|uniref:Uncharacterized protein n=1 Tax=Rubripirellula tenax TaxID=2528015 RepID=A0A5C6E9X7_9BACT|nr:hypothetical protein [Rubripirellula tenax]TWU44757.1 hypothetical protein Poly51_58230 [Rubripirellula tenax]
MNNQRTLSIQSLQHRQLMAADVVLGNANLEPLAAEVSTASFQTSGSGESLVKATHFAGQTSGSGRVISSFAGQTTGSGRITRFQAAKIDAAMTDLPNDKFGFLTTGLAGDDIGAV